MRNPTYEQVLTKEGVSWEYVERVPFDDIDVGGGLHNQARLGCALDPELVDAYAARKREGAQFPPLVLWRPGMGRYLPLDGNHNIASDQKAGRKAHDAYVVNTKDRQVADRIAWTFNNKVNGRRLSAEESLQHAVDFVRKYGMNVKQAALEWGVKQGAVYKAITAANLRDTLGRHDVKPNPSLTDDKICRMATLEKAGEDLFVAAARVVNDNGLGPLLCDEIVKEVGRAKTADEKRKVVENFATSRQVQEARALTKGGTVKTPKPLPRERLARLLTEVQRLFEDYKHDVLRPPLSSYKEVRAVAADVEDHLVTLFGLGARKAREESA